MLHFSPLELSPLKRFIQVCKIVYKTRKTCNNHHFVSNWSRRKKHTIPSDRVVRKWIREASRGRYHAFHRSLHQSSVQAELSVVTFSEKARAWHYRLQIISARSSSQAGFAEADTEEELGGRMTAAVCEGKGCRMERREQLTSNTVPGKGSASPLQSAGAQTPHSLVNKMARPWPHRGPPQTVWSLREDQLRQALKGLTAAGCLMTLRTSPTLREIWPVHFHLTTVSCMY